MNPLIDLYDIIDTLKDDNNGKVQLAYDKAGQQICIIKQRSITSSELYYKLKEIKNKYVPQIYRIMEFDETLFIVEEYIDGRTLADILQYENQINENLTVAILNQICECLKILHSQNIIHRDIKPSNIMLTKSNEVKVIDFSIARISKTGVDSDTERLGTRGYAPPEQYGFQQTDARSDIYSLGITIKRILGKDYHGFLNDVISHCTNLDPADRYDSVSELIQNLNKSRWKWRLKRLGIGVISIIFSAAIFYLIPKDIFDDDFEEPAKQIKSVEITKPVEIQPPKENQAKTDTSKKEEWAEIKWNDIKIDSQSPTINTLPDNNQNNVQNIKRNEIIYTLLLNGQKFDYDMQDINQNTWLNWQREKDIIYLPDDWTIELNINNQTESDLNDMKLFINFNREEKYIPVSTIRSYTSHSIKIPIPRKKFNHSALNFDIFLIDRENEIKFHEDLGFYLIDYPEWRAEQYHQGKFKK